jgi:hypothetical protein
MAANYAAAADDRWNSQPYRPLPPVGQPVMTCWRIPCLQALAPCPSSAVVHGKFKSSLIKFFHILEQSILTQPTSSLPPTFVQPPTIFLASFCSTTVTMMLAVVLSFHRPVGSIAAMFFPQLRNQGLSFRRGRSQYDWRWCLLACDSSGQFIRHLVQALLC